MAREGARIIGDKWIKTAFFAEILMNIGYLVVAGRDVERHIRDFFDASVPLPPSGLQMAANYYRLYLSMIAIQTLQLVLCLLPQKGCLEVCRVSHRRKLRVAVNTATATASIMGGTRAPEARKESPLASSGRTPSPAFWQDSGCESTTPTPDGLHHHRRIPSGIAAAARRGSAAKGALAPIVPDAGADGGDGGVQSSSGSSSGSSPSNSKYSPSGGGGHGGGNWIDARVLRQMSMLAAVIGARKLSYVVFIVGEIITVPLLMHLVAAVGEGLWTPGALTQVIFTVMFCLFRTFVCLVHPSWFGAIEYVAHDELTYVPSPHQ